MRYLLLLPVVFLLGCKARDGDILLGVSHLLGKKCEATLGNTPGQFTKGLRSAAGDASLSTRVMSRIRYDRYLQNAEIEVEVIAPAVVRLSGSIEDRALKLRAIELARTTVGIDRVEDDLSVTQTE